MKKKIKLASFTHFGIIAMFFIALGNAISFSLAVAAENLFSSIGFGVSTIVAAMGFFFLMTIDLICDTRE